MIKKIFIAYILITLGCGGTKKSNKLDFTLTDIEGKKWTLSEQQTIVLVNFWATWCPPCRKGIPILIKIYDKYKDKGVLIFGIAFDKEEKVRDFVVNYKINYPVFIGTKQLAENYGTIPQTYLIDKKGKIVKKWIGLSPTFEEELQTYIDSLLCQK